MKKITFIVFTFIYSLNVNSQTYSGQVVDSKSKHPISFVNAGIPSKGVGMVSDEEGRYKLILDTEFDKDTLQFSSIGYENILITVADYKKKYDTVNASFLLEQKTYNLSEVVVKPKNMISEIIGNTISKSKSDNCIRLFTLMDSVLTTNETKAKNKDKYHKFFSEKHLEIGTLFEIKKRDTYIEKVQFQFCKGQFDSITLRLNIYSNLKKETNPGMFKFYSKYENVLTAPIYFTINKNTELAEIDLTPYNIKVKDDFIVTIETLKPEDYKNIIVPWQASFGGESLVMNFSHQTPFVKTPIMKIGCNVAISYFTSQRILLK